MSSSHCFHHAPGHRYRLAAGVLTVGAISLGMLLLERLVAWANAPILDYYGLSSGEFVTASSMDVGMASVTAGQASTVLVSLLGLICFVASERRRLRRSCRQREGHACDHGIPIMARLPLRMLVDAFIMRSSLFGGVMLMFWVLGNSCQLYMAGMGWGIAFDGWMSMLPIASIFGLCLIVGMFVAAVSLFGMRVLGVLRVLAGRMWVRSQRRRVRPLRPVFSERTALERLGTAILSRPPPLGAI